MSIEQPLPAMGISLISSILPGNGTAVRFLAAQARWQSADVRSSSMLGHIRSLSANMAIVSARTGNGSVIFQCADALRLCRASSRTRSQHTARTWLRGIQRRQSGTTRCHSRALSSDGRTSSTCPSTPSARGLTMTPPYRRCASSRLITSMAHRGSQSCAQAGLSGGGKALRHSVAQAFCTLMTSPVQAGPDPSCCNCTPHSVLRHS